MRGAINAATPDAAWSCWITRRGSRVAAKAGELLATTSALAQRAMPKHRDDLAAFEREAAMAQTATAMSARQDVLKPQIAARASRKP